MKIGFIGCGNMASAIISGIRNKRSDSDEIYVYDVYEPSTLNARKEFNAFPCCDETDVVNKSDIVFLAVKPNVIASVLEKIDSSVKENNTLLISIAAGKTLEFLTGCMKNECRFIRVMPNINAKVGEAISAYCFNEYVTDEDKNSVEELLNCIGKVMCLDESYFPLFGVIGGCGPAFAYMFIDAMARAGVKNGMKKDDALKIAAQTVYGSAKMILESDEHPWKLIDNVCSPGGTTIEGVTSLQADGFESAVHNAVDKALDKDKRL
ncbi:MAG: pyrroline-5-carboxylate reductase [Eubacteriales bacterium]|nr:pyrroline-5-carboxylate reductase [Eubacteriales bacterium]